MLLTALVSLSLAFTPDASRWSGTLLYEAQAPKKKTLALPGLQGADISKDKMEFFTAHFSTQLQRLGLQVTAAEDIAAVIGLERQKQLMGCADDSSCMTEIASALGADGIITGKLAKLGDTYACNIKIIDAKSGKSIALYSATAPSEGAVLEMLALAAKDLFNQLRNMTPGKSTPTAATSSAASGGATESSGLRKFGKFTMITSGVLLAVGLVSFTIGLATQGEISTFFGITGLLEVIAAPGIFLIGLVCYLVGEDRVVPVKQALLRGTPFKDVAVSFAPTTGGGAAALALWF